MMWFPPRDPVRERNLTRDECEAILRASDNPPTPIHIRVFVHIMLRTGVYGHALHDLKWKSVNFDDRTIVFEAKGKSKAVTALIDDGLLKVLHDAEDLSPPGCEYVMQFFGEPVKSVYVGLSALFERAEVENVIEADLRRASATFAVAPGDAPTVAATPAVSTSHLFISYCSRDADTRAFELVNELERVGRSCWIAPRNLKAGVYAGQINRAIKGCSALIVLITPGANESAPVLAEVSKAADLRKTVLPMILENTTPGEDLDFYCLSRQQVTWTNAAQAAKAILEKLQKT